MHVSHRHRYITREHSISKQLAQLSINTLMLPMLFPKHSVLHKSFFTHSCTGASTTDGDACSKGIKGGSSPSHECSGLLRSPITNASLALGSAVDNIKALPRNGHCIQDALLPPCAVKLILKIVNGDTRSSTLPSLLPQELHTSRAFLSLFGLKQTGCHSIQVAKRIKTVYTNGTHCNTQRAALARWILEQGVSPCLAGLSPCGWSLQPVSLLRVTKLLQIR
mmetsp:Transcript_20086/g.60672  ORF Transcript_20086/g.60672 Transcript_20086/m.60672 type:complete len:222 (+) Transcript_20086:52-717(+)